MACGGCNRKAAKNTQYAWTPPAGSPLPPMVYDTELEAKAKVMRRGGTYKPQPKV